MLNAIHSVRSFIRDKTGATVVEYALMLSLIALVIIGAAGVLGTQTSAWFINVGNTI
jgi:pilus assembly protein Flp/PilA